MIDGDILANYIQELDQYIYSTPIDSDEIVNAYCNECNLHFDIKFHPIGLKCNQCGGYNTKL
jgi:RING finger/CHY zinc finger protein 1